MALHIFAKCWYSFLNLNIFAVYIYFSGPLFCRYRLLVRDYKVYTGPEMARHRACKVWLLNLGLRIARAQKEEIHTVCRICISIYTIVSAISDSKKLIMNMEKELFAQKDTFGFVFQNNVFCKLNQFSISSRAQFSSKTVLCSLINYFFLSIPVR